MPYRSTEVLSPGPKDKTPLHSVALAHDARHLRRKLLHLENDDVVMLDLKEAVMLADGDLLVLEGGGYIRIVAAPEALYEIRPRDPLHLIELAWHLGNRHLAAQIETGRILISRDPVIRQMLEGLSAEVREVSEPFHPVRGAYHAGGHNHGHHHG
ncbi:MULTISPECIES: urease accessory protein UreE [unclassified Ensifer]|uniref:urease accessory protein UreE n=1 Tax=unclassified Ensifer TaxID=2633371 RepID=UPI000813A789|nr:MULTISPECIES: urease accessory protein UreE [unclassified Ensifer]OCP02390.1 urease accessory protein UreE [Ensifer sp. LC14]OCP14124.1 urease accessory protein UreE [Ensifer sp. LC13]OCP14800.1 urease accessory protein UreE [Ensifer sp. LC11]OCP34287.1 urease accessory protein UreE [Ensifer sp. LC499]